MSAKGTIRRNVPQWVVAGLSLRFDAPRFAPYIAGDEQVIRPRIFFQVPPL
jgi:hypothetical protein